MGKQSFLLSAVAFFVCGSISGGALAGGPREAAVKAIKDDVETQVEKVLATALGPVYQEWKRAEAVIAKGRTRFNTVKGEVDDLYPAEYLRAENFDKFMAAQRQQLRNTGQLLPFRSTNFDPNPDLNPIDLKVAVAQAGVPTIEKNGKPIDLGTKAGQAKLASMVKVVELEGPYARAVVKLMDEMRFKQNEDLTEEAQKAADRGARLKLRSRMANDINQRAAKEVETKAVLAELKELGAVLSKNGQKAALKKWSVPVLTAIGLAGGASAASAGEGADLSDGGADGVDHKGGGDLVDPAK